MKLSFFFFSDKPDYKWELCKQMGIRYAIAKLAPELTGKLPPWDFETLSSAKKKFAQHGFQLIGFEGDQMDMTRIKLGLPGKEEDIELYKQMLVNMGKLDINLLCYNFMPTGWFRTSHTTEERGGALVTSFDYNEAKKLPLTSYGIISAQTMWKNYQWFIEQIMPTAEESGVKMALHPDDPPVPELQGIARIFINAEAIRRALSLSNSPSHGLTFCQGTYLSMGENLSALIKEFGELKKIFFVHLRDIRGTADSFHETFHDNGPTDFPALLNLYKEIGFKGAIRSDHVPSMFGENNNHPGYGMTGNLFGIGYIKGIMDTLKIESSSD